MINACCLLSTLISNHSLCFALFAVFKFSEVDFKTFLDIPERLLKSIVLCFREKMVVCRKCFYGERHLSRRQAEGEVLGGQEEEVCSTGEHKWSKPVVVIPGTCVLCRPSSPTFSFIGGSKERNGRPSSPLAVSFFPASCRAKSGRGMPPIELKVGEECLL